MVSPLNAPRALRQRRQQRTQRLLALEAVSQSLPGRTGMLHLLPLSIPELSAAGIQFDSFEDYLLHGFLPRVHAQNQRPRVAYASDYQTFVERDVRQLIKLKNGYELLEATTDKCQLVANVLEGVVLENG